MPRDMTWRYHATQAPKMVPMDDDERLEQMAADGWSDTPAAFHDADAPEGPSHPTNELDAEHQALLDSFADDPASLTRDEMAAVAGALGEKVTTRTGKPALAEILAAYLTE